MKAEPGLHLHRGPAAAEGLAVGDAASRKRRYRDSLTGKTVHVLDGLVLCCALPLICLT